MKKYPIINLKLILFSFCVFIASNNSFAQKNKTPIDVSSGVIPPNFKENNDTLLIYSVNPFYTMSMKKHFKKYYTGNFKFVKNPADYSLENCRYVMYEGTKTTIHTTVGGPRNGQSRDVVTHLNYKIVDRKTEKEYINPNLASPKLIKEYLLTLDAARL